MTDALDYNLARAMFLALETEVLFGMDQIAKEGWGNPQEEIASPVAISDLLKSPEVIPGKELKPTSEALGVDLNESRKTEDSEPRTLAVVKAEVATCRECRLCETRVNTVPGSGPTTPRLMFIGDVPSSEDETRGEAFRGAAGELLDKMIAAMGLKREDIYLTNALKCRPGQDLAAQSEESQACWHFLKEEIDLLKPEVICSLGSLSTALLLKSSHGLDALRGQVQHFEGIKLVPTYHPETLLKDPSFKRPTWQDLQLVMEILAESKD